MHGARPTRRKASEFGMRLRGEQKLGRIYCIYETQFKTYFQQAARAKGLTGSRLLQLLETRLDNIVYRLGRASSRKEARQLVVHGHVAVDGKKVTIPAYQVRPGQAVSLTERGQKHGRLKELLGAAGRAAPSWLGVASHPRGGGGSGGRGGGGG